MKSFVNATLVSLLFVFALSIISQPAHAWGHYYKLKLIRAKVKTSPIVRKAKPAIKKSTLIAPPSVIDRTLPPLLTEIVEQNEIDVKALKNEKLTNQIVVEKPILKHRLRTKKTIIVAVTEVNNIPIQKVKGIATKERANDIKNKELLNLVKTSLVILFLLVLMFLFLFLGRIGAGAILFLLLLLILLLVAILIALLIVWVIQFLIH